MSSCNEIKDINYQLPKECPQKNCTINANSLVEIEKNLVVEKWKMER